MPGQIDRVCGAHLEAVLIAGPTASGKSALAIEIAKATGGVVVNADSMQVYRDLRVVTARPGPEDEAAVSHLLYGQIDADTDYSVGRWMEDVAAVLSALKAAGRLPIIVGGTGLYFRALTVGLAPIPPIPEAVRARVRAEAEGESSAILHSQLATRDPLTAFRLRPNDRQRILRALEVVEATGRPLAEWQGTGGEPLVSPERSCKVVLDLERETLKARIDGRFAQMMQAGALDEVRNLVARDLPADRTIMKALGVPPLMRHLAGELSLEHAVTQAQTDSRRYSKRQQTWFRHQMPGWERHAPQDARAAILAQLT